MKELKQYLKYDQILSRMLENIHIINNMYQRAGEVPKLDFGLFNNERESIISDLELIQELCLKELKGTPDRIYDFHRHLKFSCSCDYADILSHDLPALKSWIANKFMDPRNLVFIAMSFSLDIRSKVQEAIEYAYSQLGYIATTVDKYEHNGGITDKIMDMINRSKFVIADFTEQKSGVYYAAGQGKTVIYCVYEGDLDNTHFDIKHINLVVWKDTHELISKLTTRIQETII